MFSYRKNLFACSMGVESFPLKEMRKSCITQSLIFSTDLEKLKQNLTY